MLFWSASRRLPLIPALEHAAPVSHAAFSPDGTRVVTASRDGTARIWDVRIDEGTLEQWSAVAERSPFVVRDGVLVRRVPHRLEAKSAP